MANVVIYGTDEKGPFRYAKAILDEYGIEYEEREAAQGQRDDEGRVIERLPHIVVDGQLYGTDIVAAINAAGGNIQQCNCDVG
jgi:hypothetical protein